MKKLVLLAAFVSTQAFAITLPYDVVSSTIGKTTTGAKSTDIYLVYCPASAPYGVGYINDNLPVKPQGVTIQLVSGLNLSSKQLDTVDGDIKPSGQVLVKNAKNYFLAYATKEASATPGAENYTMTLGCYKTFSGGYSWVKPMSVKLYKRM